MPRCPQQRAQLPLRWVDQVYTEIVPLDEFYLAEYYHQKFRLKQSPVFANQFSTIYPDHADLVDSTAAARVNGYLGGL